MVLFCRLAVRPDHFQFLRFFLYLSIPVNFQECHDFGLLNFDMRGTQVTRQIMCVSSDFHSFYNFGMSQAWVSKEPIIVFPTDGTLKMFTKTDYTSCSLTLSNIFRIADFPAVFFVMEHSFNNQQLQQMKIQVQIS